MAQSKSAMAKVTLRRQVVLLLVLLIFLYGIVPRLSGLSESFDGLAHADLGRLMVAVGLYLVLFLVASTIYMVLAVKPLKYWPTLQVQIATGFTGKLLPAGLGTAALAVQYLRAQRHTTAGAVAVVGVNNLLGITGHVSLLLVGLLVLRPALPEIAVHVPIGLMVISGVAVAGLLISLLTFRKFRTLLKIGIRNVLVQLAQYRQRPLHLFLALGLAMVLTLLYCSVLHVTAGALHVVVPFETSFLVFSLGMIVATATPTPGGAIGSEAGIAAGFVAYGLPVHEALAVALLYRLITYWLPILPGLASYLFVRRKYRLY